MTNLGQIWSCRPLIRSVTHQRVISDGPESPKYAHKFVLPENVTIIVFYMVIRGEMDRRVAKLINLAQKWIFRPVKRPIICQQVMLEGF